MNELLPRFESEFPQKADIILIGMGVNDCKEGTSMKQWRVEWENLLLRLREYYPKALVLCSSAPPLMSFPALPLSVRLFLGCRADLMNAILQKLVNKRQKTLYLPIPDFLSAEYFASDGFHPNALAHRKWADAVLSALRKEGLE